MQGNRHYLTTRFAGSPWMHYHILIHNNLAPKFGKLHTHTHNTRTHTAQIDGKHKSLSKQ
jgi:hypothetical protein